MEIYWYKKCVKSEVLSKINCYNHYKIYIIISFFLKTITLLVKDSLNPLIVGDELVRHADEDVSPSSGKTS